MPDTGVWCAPVGNSFRLKGKEPAMRRRTLSTTLWHPRRGRHNAGFVPRPPLACPHCEELTVKPDAGQPAPLRRPSPR
jgi:hypothetical protein